MLQDLHSHSFFTLCQRLLQQDQIFHCTPPCGVPTIIPPNAFHYLKISSMIHGPQPHNNSNTIPYMGDQMHIQTNYWVKRKLVPIVQHWNSDRFWNKAFFHWPNKVMHHAWFTVILPQMVLYSDSLCRSCAIECVYVDTRIVVLYVACFTIWLVLQYT